MGNSNNKLTGFFLSLSPSETSDLSRAFAPFKRHMTLLGPEDFRDGEVKYGQMVVPSVLDNFGPMYLSRIHRIN